jgi:hypothetical protein
LSCFSCCNNNHRRHQGYTQAPPPVSQFPQYTQYQPAAAPVYRSQQQQQQQKPQYAHFDAPSKPFNEDALPAMPSWNNSRTLRQQDNEINEMEMGSMHNQAAQPMLPKSPRAQVQEYPYQANAGAYGGDLASSRAELPQQPQQYGYGRQSPRVAAQGYEGSIAAPPSYHTTAPAQGVARKPVSGSWRDLWLPPSFLCFCCKLHSDGVLFFPLKTERDGFVFWFFAIPNLYDEGGTGCWFILSFLVSLLVFNYPYSASMPFSCYLDIVSRVHFPPIVACYFTDDYTTVILSSTIDLHIFIRRQRSWLQAKRIYDYMAEDVAIEARGKTSLEKGQKKD